MSNVSSVLGGGITRETSAQSQIAESNGNIQAGPALPYNVSYPCLEAINETHIFLAGGYAEGVNIHVANESRRREAYMIVWSTKTWIAREFMSMGR